MARTPTKTAYEVDQARLNWLIKQLRDVRKDRQKASEDASHSAVSQLRREERNLRDQIDRARYALAQQQRVEEASKPESPEERAQLLGELVENASGDELEVAVAEYLRRNRYEMSADEDGTLRIVPLGESGLRLVKS